MANDFFFFVLVLIVSLKFYIYINVPKNFNIVLNVLQKIFDVDITLVFFVNDLVHVWPYDTIKTNMKLHSIIDNKIQIQRHNLDSTHNLKTLQLLLPTCY